MSKTEAIKKNPVYRFFNNEENFRFVFISSLFFGYICLIGSYFYVIAGISMIWACYLFIFRTVRKGYILRIRNRNLIYIFLGFAFLTCVLHGGTNFFLNVYMVAWMAVCFFFFYGIYAGRSKNRCRYEVQRILEFINTATNVIMVIGLIFLFIFPAGFVINGYSFAIHENRFVGIISNANVTAFYAVVGIISCNILWAMKKSVGKLGSKMKIYYIFCIAVNTMSLFLTDSNDSLLMLMAYLCFILLYVIFKGHRHTALNFIMRIVAFILGCAVIISVAVGGRTLLQEGTSYLLNVINPPSESLTDVPEPNGNIIIKPNTQDSKTTFGHLNTNLDSGRFVIWKQSLGLFEKFPILGIGKANIIDYGKEYLGGLKYEDFHNGLITIIISYGLIGFIIFMIFAITVGKTILKALFRYRDKNRIDGRVLTFLTAFCAAYCIYSMFEVALLADLSYRVLIFWLFVGLAMSYTSSYEKSALITHSNISKRSRSVYRVTHFIGAGCKFHRRRKV